MCRSPKDFPMQSLVLRLHIAMLGYCNLALKRIEPGVRALGSIKNKKNGTKMNLTITVQENQFAFSFEKNLLESAKPMRRHKLLKELKKLHAVEAN
jgi:hypothetical protein